VADLDGSGLADVAVTDIGDDSTQVFLNPAVAAVPDDGGRVSVIKRSGREGGWLGGMALWDL
jgi:hypothetical protein